MDKLKIQEKLKKIKALAEHGVDGEKEGALELYQRLLAKYELTDEDVEEVQISRRWFRYTDELDKKLLTQIFYKVTGSPTFYEKLDKRRRMVSTDCTDFEFDQIVFYYQFYKEHMKSELSKFIAAFLSVNNLFPDETTRCYEESKDIEDTHERSLEEITKIGLMASGMEKKTPYNQIEDRHK